MPTQLGPLIWHSRLNHILSGHLPSFFRAELPCGVPYPVWAVMNRSIVIVEYFNTGLGHIHTTEYSVPHDLNIFESFQEDRSVMLELGGYLNVFSPLLLQNLFVVLLDSLAFRCLFLLVRCSLSLDIVD